MKKITLITCIIVMFAAASFTACSETKVSTNDIAVSTSDSAKPTATQNVPREYSSALKKAKTYAETMHMSKKGVYNQLISPYGEKFTEKAAQYAIDNLVTNWNEHALAKAKTYQNTMNMSANAIRDQLTSESGEKFTEVEANYAVAHLPK